MEHPSEDHDVAAAYATYLLLAEAGFGGIFHSLHFPFTGNILSLNQVFLITRALHISRSDTLLPCTISTIAGLLKFLCPIGKKVIPMLVIVIQGLLYNLGLLILGNTPAGRIVGATLLSIWGFIQPLLVYYLIFDAPLYQSVLHMLQQLQPILNIPLHLVIAIVFLLIGTKVIIAIGIVIATPYIPQSKFEKYVATLSKTTCTVESSQQRATVYSAALTALKDLHNPLFLICLGLTVSFLYFVEESPHWFLWGVVRPCVVGFACFFLLRWIPIDACVSFLERKRTGRFTRSLRNVLYNLRTS